MHSLHFSLMLDRDITVDEVKERLMENTRIAVTHKTSANQVFSFGRDHGYYGRLMSQAVIPLGNSCCKGRERGCRVLVYNLKMATRFSHRGGHAWYLDSEMMDDRLDILRRYLFAEI